MSPPATCFTNDAELELLRRLLGRRVGRIFGTPFLVEGALTVTMRLAWFTGNSGRENPVEEYLSFSSDRYETARYADYALFHLGLASTLEEALGNTGAMYVDTSVSVGHGQESIVAIRVLAARVDEGEDQMDYDAVLRLELEGGRALSIGHAPGVFEGVCFTYGEQVTLGNPTHLYERLVLT